MQHHKTYNTCSSILWYILCSLDINRYKWTKNNVEIKIGSDMELNGGMLSIEYPNPKHEGIYQCVATNNYGVAVSIRTNLKLAGKKNLKLAEN